MTGRISRDLFLMKPGAAAKNQTHARDLPLKGLVFFRASVILCAVRKKTVMEMRHIL